MTTTEHEYVTPISVPVGYQYPREILRIDMPVKFVAFRSRHGRHNFFAVSAACLFNDCDDTSLGESLTTYIKAVNYTVATFKQHLKYEHPVDLRKFPKHEREMGNNLLEQYYETLSTALIETLRVHFT